jgi:hypothetical protein
MSLWRDWAYGRGWRDFDALARRLGKTRLELLNQLAACGVNVPGPTVRGGGS